MHQDASIEVTELPHPVLIMPSVVEQTGRTLVIT
jgi:hypothetical protein